MAYISNIPQPTDAVKDSQPLILGNFTEIPTLLEINHIGFVGGADDGKHIKVDFTASATHPVVAANQLLIYNYVNPTTTENELYVKKVGGLATAGIPFTASLDAAEGYTYLPSGILIRWGNDSGTGEFSITKNNAPKFSHIYNIQLTAKTSGVGDTNKAIVYQSSVLTGAGFTINVAAVERLSATPATVICHWMVIGV